ncbi:MAG: TIGR00266 family protein [Armatimonadetes bacterium]|nr:TIGR00266 family protein [Armatimonadota bacterium]MDE2206131.1 TIGR00266 family protein [Armatimonadota bacterium]
MMEYRVIGDVMQCVSVELQPGEEVQAEAGAMIYLTDSVQINTKMTGGLMAGLGRMLGGSTAFFSHFQAVGAPGVVAFAAHYPGHTRQLTLKNDAWLCSKESFLFSQTSVQVSIALTKRLGAGFFGGAGFILQRLAGMGDAFIHGGGNFVEFDLQPGQRLRVEAGCAVAFQESVSYDVEFIGGLQNTLFGGEGIFLISMVGPGHVILSTMPFSRMAGAILAHQTTNTASSGLGNVLGDVLGNL